ncbi:MAG: hypothetical protein ABSC05_15950 [Candidatus Solibacter sp.]
MRMLLVPALAGLLPIMLSGQVGLETASQGATREYPIRWPEGPRPGSLPDWARPGRIRFSRWDGGRIETAKAVLSGWPGFNPPDPNRIYALTNWYDPRTVRYLRDAAVNLICVTFSNGFSVETQSQHQEEVRKYIQECHRQGIRVLAYESIANINWENMFVHVPESRDWIAKGKDGKPIAYGAADYALVGRITRYMADLNHPGWRGYLRKNIDLALDAGADGVLYDNNSLVAGLLETYQDIYQYAASRKPDFLLMGNFHGDTYVFNRLTNSMTTEDGEEPGIYSERNLTAFPFRREQPSLLAVGSGYLVNNIGMLRIHSALSQGWKPVLIEDGYHESGHRWTSAMSAQRHQLAMAECRAFGASLEVEKWLGLPGPWQLTVGEPELSETWRAIGRYNRFFADNEQYYMDTQSLASLAVVIDDRSSNVALLNGLAARGVLYDVLYEHDLTDRTLKSYAAVAVLTAETVRDRALTALENYVRGGGKLVAAANSASLDEAGRKRPKPAFFGQKTGDGQCTYYEHLPALDELAKVLRADSRPPAVQMDARAGILYNPVWQPRTGRLLVHLLNYTARPVSGIKLRIPGHCEIAGLLSPDSAREPVRMLGSSREQIELEIPRLDTYSLLVLANCGSDLR